MKSYKVHRIKKALTTSSSSEELMKETEDYLNTKANEGFELVNVSFDFSTNSGYVYSFIVHKR